jgi:hypothetical protein
MGKARRLQSARTPDPEAQLATFIAKFDAQIAAVIRQSRKRLRSIFPTAHEIVYDNYNFFVIGYSPTLRPSDTIVSLAAAANGVGLSFYRGATLPDPQNLLIGSGKQNRFIRLPNAKVLGEKAVTDLIEAAVAQSNVPLQLSGKVVTVIKSVSVKQRPRRKVQRVA